MPSHLSLRGSLSPLKGTPSGLLANPTSTLLRQRVNVPGISGEISVDAADDESPGMNDTLPSLSPRPPTLQGFGEAHSRAKREHLIHLNTIFNLNNNAFISPFNSSN
jgi:hypothetical protein